MTRGLLPGVLISGSIITPERRNHRDDCPKKRKALCQNNNYRKEWTGRQLLLRGNQKGTAKEEDDNDDGAFYRAIIFLQLYCLIVMPNTTNSRE